MSNAVHHRHHNHHHHHHDLLNRTSSGISPSNNTNQNFDHHNYLQTPSLTPLSLSSIQCSAYFIHRVDLDNYTVYTIKQTVDNVITEPRTKGLKVVLCLPDEGLIIDNIPDPNQSWMYKRSELLYLWHDSHYLNIIVIITINRSNYHANAPFSASIFRLRGYDSVSRFLQRAQQFFAELLSTSVSRTNSRKSIEKLATVEDWVLEGNKKKERKKSKHQPTIDEQPVTKPSHSRPTTPIRLVTRTEFDPGKTTKRNPVSHSSKNRSHSETTVSTDIPTPTVKQSTTNRHKATKTKTTDNNVSDERITVLLRELQELRLEVAALKSEPRFTPVRSSSTSPMPEFMANPKQRMNSSSQSEIDTATQTDLSLFHQTELNTVSNGKESTADTGPYKIVPSLYIQEPHQSTSLPIRPRSLLKTNQNISTNSNGSTEEKATESAPSGSTQAGEVVSFRSSFENTIASSENIYENIPTPNNINSDQGLYCNIPIINKTNQQQQGPSVNVTIVGEQNSESHQQYLKQLFGPQNGISLLIPERPSVSKENPTTEKSELIVPNSHYPQLVFANHLTSPFFNLDKQLLANTIANQFGVDLQSPYLQKLMTNQHLFLAQRRTFANMVWQITPEEKHALCSSPLTSNNNTIDTIDSNSATAKSILKLNKFSRPLAKKQHIRWDRTLE